MVGFLLFTILIMPAIDLPDADLYFDPLYLPVSEADLLFEHLLHQTDWQEDRIKIFGKEYLQPRLTALYATNKNPYSYSGLTLQPAPFPEPILKIKNKLQNDFGIQFTTCLLNLYRNGEDSNGWHADNERELGKQPKIASISLGATRKFKLKHIYNKSLKHDIMLPHRSLLLMQGNTQHFWKHQIPKTKKLVGPRINLTFRIIKNDKQKI